jgi:tRNA A-37 threonylcarbamoyl transferase component Bud32/tetratricopeptide (TPR) repeat protein
MTPERFRQIEELYHAAREGTADERAALLAQADPDLRREVESLLIKQAGGEFIDRPAIRNAPHLLEDPTLTRLASGARLGPYRIEGKLGEGGMGEVFRAIDTRLGRAVAIKTVREQFNDRFEREARAISSLNHPNICTLFDLGSNYLVMELVEGETLAARLKHGPLPIQTALLYGSQIADAMVEAHGKGIVHRDLKPSNIMIGKTGVKVLDFGLARSDQDETVTASHMVVGTPAYMAPEQRQGKPADARTDIYAFGCVLYEMLTGERVALGRRRIRTRKVETLVSRCLEVDPGRRWQSAGELQRELAVAPRASRALHDAAHTSLPRGPKAIRKYKIVLGEFENKTGDPVFDGILRQGLSLQLEHSSFLTLVSDQQVQQMLRFMNRPPETRLTPDIAQEICERTGGTAVIDGWIASLGSRFVLWLRARNGAGDTLGQEQAQAGTKDEVLNALTQMADQTKRQLGESFASMREDSTPLEQATTPSLEALKAYSAARSAMFSRGMATAVPLLQRAVAIDPQFAMAQADLGFFYWNMGKTDIGAEYVRRAYELRDRVSDRERFFIIFLYDRQVTGNLQKELETLESWEQADPRDFYPWGLLGGWGTMGTGQYQRGIQASEQALRLNPDATPAFVGLFVHNLGLGRLTEAAAALRRAAERKREVPHLLVSRYHLAFLEGDDAGMKREIDRARGKLEAEGWMSHNEALVLAHSGQMRNARIRWRHIIELAHQGGDSEKGAIYQAAEAVCEAHFGNWDRAKELAWAALELGKGRDVEYAAAFVLALSGDVAASHRLAEDLAKRFPEDTPVQFEYLPTLRALFALHDKSPLDAIERLQTAIPYDLAMPGTAYFAKFGGLYPAYVRGQAYLEAGWGREAEAEFQKVLDHRGIVLADPIGALAHLQLGRALVLSGERDRARRAYQDFLTLWRDADPDIPILNQGKAEYDKMR